MKLASILLQAPAAAPGGGMWQQIFLIAIIIVIFYFFLIRPQMKRNKEQKKFREGLQRGQKVITIGGIHGKISELQETTVTLEIESNVHIKLEKSAIASSISDQLNENSSK
ncbi:MAG: preprotein translocase subunit YajC [Bacteroidales bacterium]